MKLSVRQIELIEKLKAILGNEFGNYSLISYKIIDIDIEEDVINIQVETNENDLSFKIEDNKILIETCEDCYEEIEPHDESIKHLWIKLLWKGFSG